MVLGYHICIGKLIFGIHLMIPRVLHDPNATEKKTPGSCLIASFDQNITLYILHVALKLCYKGLGVWGYEKNLLWHSSIPLLWYPFDD